MGAITGKLLVQAAFIPLIIAIFIPTEAFGAVEDLDAAIARRDRQVSAVWPTSELEDPSNHYIWQPETLMYHDVATGHEVWVLTHAPDISSLYSREHGTNMWSFDGATVGFFSTYRPTHNPALNQNDYHERWLVNTDGTGLRCAEGYGRRGITFDFGWAHTEKAYYVFGSSPAEMPGSSNTRIFKNSLDINSRVTGQLVLDTSNVDGLQKDFVKEGISTDDSHAVFRSFVFADYDTPNQIQTTKVYFAQLGSNPSVLSHWGVARKIGPEADPYGSHINASEAKFHDIWSPGPTGSWIIGDYSGTSSIFAYFKQSGSYSDGGPLWEDWDGDSFGLNEEVKVVSDGAGEPDNPYGLPYFGHPVFDRWGKYALIGTYTDTPKPGTRLVDMQTLTLLDNYVLSYDKYDGQHHSWTGWTDYVVAVNPKQNWEPPETPYMLMANKWNSSHESTITVADSHNEMTDNYMAYPRPSQSPDGSKVGFASTFLNNMGDDFPYIQWAVVHYPYPPELSGAALVAGNVRLSWDFAQDTPTPRTYTTRGWPDENTDLPPSPREIKAFRVWQSADAVHFKPALGTIAYNNRAGRWTETSWSYDAQQPVATTRHYGVTSIEHSGLESRILSNIWTVTVDGSGSIVASNQSVGYPAEPGAVFKFAFDLPPSPKVTSIQKDPEIPAHYRLSWDEPPEHYSTIRYYNIYYSTAGAPTATRQNRIASVAKGVTKFLDWNADPAITGYYLITSVDTQGNEGVAVAPLPPVAQ
jgi:hypothetical protein